MAPNSERMERELLGICKHSMLQLGDQLRDYINRTHKTEEAGIIDVDQVILRAASELCSNDTTSSCTGDMSLIPKSNHSFAFNEYANEVRLQTYPMHDHYSPGITRAGIDKSTSNSNAFTTDEHESLESARASGSVVMEDTVDNSADIKPDIQLIFECFSTSNGPETSDHANDSAPSMTSPDPLAPLTATSRSVSHDLDYIGQNQPSTSSAVVKRPVIRKTNRQIVVAERRPQTRKPGSIKSGSRDLRGINLSGFTCPYCNLAQAGGTRQMLSHIHIRHNEFVTPHPPGTEENPSPKIKYSFKCQHCPAVILSGASSSVIRHYLCVHPDVYKLRCAYCEFSTDKKEVLTDHYARGVH